MAVRKLGSQAVSVWIVCSYLSNTLLNSIMEGKKFDVVNWKIKNFSCWNQALHEKCLTTSRLEFPHHYLTMKLYPRMTSGLEESMGVHLSGYCDDDFLSGDLLFIGSDGSTLCTQQVDIQHSKKEIPFYLVMSPGPNFQEVIDKIRENESDHEDQLTLRLQVASDERNEINACTVIDVFEVNLKVVSIAEGDNYVSYIRCVQDAHDEKINFKITQRDKDNKTKLDLESVTSNWYPFLIQTQLSLINNAGSLMRNENNDHVFYEKEQWTFANFLTQEQSENFQSLILRLKIISGKVSHSLQNVFLYSLYSDSVQIKPFCCKNGFDEKSNSIDPNDNSVEVLSKDMECLYQAQDFSDLQIKCGSDSFPVHKIILSARSPVFKTMLSSDMTEAASGIVDIEDLDAAILSRFLRFLYTGMVDLQGDDALKLYYAADKYEVTSLRQKCVKFLISSVSASNVCDILLLGDQHRDEVLISAAHKFIFSNLNAFLKTSEWRSFICREPLLAAKTVTHFAEKDYFKNM